MEDKKISGLRTWWWKWIIRHCRWSLAKKYISTLFFHNLPKFHTIDVNRSKKRKWFHIKKSRSRRYPAETITNADYAAYLTLLANIPARAKYLLYNQKQVAGGICFNTTANKTKFMCFKQEGPMSILKLVDQFTCFSSNISYTENDVIIPLEKTWTAIERLSI